MKSSHQSKWVKKRVRKRRLHGGFMDLEKAYDKANRNALYQVLIMHVMGGYLLNGIESMCAIV